MLVRERHFLYDAKDNNYKNRGKVAEAWLEIAREMGNENGKSKIDFWGSCIFSTRSKTSFFKENRNVFLLAVFCRIIIELQTL